MAEVSKQEIQARFEHTIRNLLAMPPIRQKQVAKRGRRARLFRKIQASELEHLISICQLVNPDNDIPTEQWDRAADEVLNVFMSSDTLDAIESCLKELKLYREK